MFSSSSNLNPFQYTTASQSMIAGSSNYTHNPSSFQQDHSSPFPHFTAPFLDDGDLLLNEFLSQQHQRQEQLEGQLLRSNATPLADGVEGIDVEAADKAKTTKKKKDRSVKAEKQPVPRRRTGKKDRHSKIYTAQGPRDRRMRLSLHIARKFFDLQDMLGFDKASKTIEWLFSKSKAAIKDLTDNLPGANKSRSTAAGGKSASSTSESEVVSVTKLTPDGGGGGGGGDHNRGMVLVAAEDESFASIPGEKRNKRSHKNKPPPSMNPVAKDSRNKARARARERTKEKLKIKDLDKLKQRCPYQSNPNHLEQLGSSSVSLGNGENRGSGTGSQDMCSTIKAVMLQEESNTYLQPQNQMTSVGTAGKPFKAAAAPRSSSIFDFSGNYEILGGPNIENELSGIPATWDLNNIAKIQYRYFAMPSVRLPTGNSHVQSPNAIFIPIPQNAQEPKTSSASYMSSSTIPEENLASIFMTTSITQQINPSQVLMDISNPTDQPNPSSILMSSTESGLHSHFMGHQFSSNSNLSKYGGSY